MRRKMIFQKARPTSKQIKSAKTESINYFRKKTENDEKRQNVKKRRFLLFLEFFLC